MSANEIDDSARIDTRGVSRDVTGTCRRCGAPGLRSRGTLLRVPRGARTGEPIGFRLREAGQREPLQPRFETSGRAVALEPVAEEHRAAAHVAPNWGRITSTVTTSRQIQLGLKYLF